MGESSDAIGFETAVCLIWKKLQSHKESSKDVSDRLYKASGRARCVQIASRHPLVVCVRTVGILCAKERMNIKSLGVVVRFGAWRLSEVLPSRKQQGCKRQAIQSLRRCSHSILAHPPLSFFDITVLVHRDPKVGSYKRTKRVAPLINADSWGPWVHSSPLISWSQLFWQRAIGER